MFRPCSEWRRFLCILACFGLMRGYPDGLRAWDMPFATIVETLYEAKLLLTLGWVGHHATIAYLAVI